MRKTIAVMSLAALALVPPAARAETLPTMRGVDHIGVTVYDTKQAVDFFQNVLGCKAMMSFGPFLDPKGNFMKDLLHVHPRAVINRITMVRCGNGSNVELLEYRSPDQNKTMPRNSDLGGHHIAFYVDDIKKAAAYLRAHGVTTFFGPMAVKEGPAAGQTILYFLTPWGLQMELISYPKGMAYEKTATGKLWSPKDQK